MGVNDKWAKLRLAIAAFLLAACTTVALLVPGPADSQTPGDDDTSSPVLAPPSEPDRQPPDSDFGSPPGDAEIQARIDKQAKQNPRSPKGERDRSRTAYTDLDRGESIKLFKDNFDFILPANPDPEKQLGGEAIAFIGDEAVVVEGEDEEHEVVVSRAPLSVKEEGKKRQVVDLMA